YARSAPRWTVQKITRFVSDTIQGAREKASNALAAMGLKRKLTRMQKVQVALRNDLLVELARKSDIVKVSLRSSDPDKGTQIIGRFIELYQENHLRAYQTPKARQFFQSERDRLRKELTDAEEQMSRCKAEHA